MASLVRHLHGFVRDVEPTPEEWMPAHPFLTRTGQTCTDIRQEFILLSDVLGVSMLVDAINHRQPEARRKPRCWAPPSWRTRPALPRWPAPRPETRGERVDVEGEFPPRRTPLEGAPVDVWQSGQRRRHDVQRPELDEGHPAPAASSADAAARCASGPSPRAYPIPYDGPVGDLLKAARHPARPAHLHFMVAAPGFETR